MPSHEQRKARLTHYRAYDKMYDATQRRDRRAYDTARYFAMREKRVAQIVANARRNREKIRARNNPIACAEAMIAEALS